MDSMEQKVVYSYLHNGTMAFSTFRQEQFLKVQLTIWQAIILVKYIGSKLSLTVCTHEVLDVPDFVEG